MADLIPCEITEECNCQCNCQAYFPDNRLFTVESLEIDGYDYAFSYLITNPDPALNYIIFCIQCPTTTFEVSSSNTIIEVIGNPYGSHVTVPFTVEYDASEEETCCFYQGVKINVTPPTGVTEMQFIITFTVPEGVVLSFQPGSLKIKNGEEYGVANYVCMPGCENECDREENTCLIWLREKDIIVSKKDIFIHYSQNLFPIDFDFSTISLSAFEQKIRLLQKIEKSIAKLNCDVAKVLEALNNNEEKDNCCI
jgi:hypothetical protein